MVKRYSGGLMGATATNSYGILRSGIYASSNQAQSETGSWPELSPPITYMVVAAGGGGGRNNGGGGGGGGLLTNVGETVLLTAPGTKYTVVIGAGGTGQSTNSVAGQNGSNSFLVGVGKNTSTTDTYAGFFSGTVSNATSKYYCTLPANADFAMGTGNFTIEGWFYVTGSGSQYPTGYYRTVASTRATATTSGTTTFSCGINPAGGAYFYTNTLEVDTDTNNLQLNNWAHVAWVRSGTTMTVYINGVSVGSGTSTDNLTVNTMSFGANLDGSESWEGLISNLRITKGVSVYTNNFTVPAMPLTATQSAGTNISAITAGQCSLLTLQSDTVVDNSGNSFTITQVGTIIVLPYGNDYILVNAMGGGVGGGYGIAGRNGGSGGGGGSAQPAGAGRAGQGYSGGSGTASIANPYAAAGGGGAGGPGLASSNTTATIGGPGATNSILSSTATLYYAGGGSGCGYNTIKPQQDGGGQASTTTSGGGTAGTTNRGGGGGGAAYNGTGGTGGSGIVVISYPSYYANASSTTGSPTYSTNGNNRVYSFTGSGTITF